jgi:hypothetical protein
MISIHKIFPLIAQLGDQFKDDIRLDRNMLKCLFIHIAFSIFTIIPIILAVLLAGETNSQIVQTKVIFNEVVYRLHDRDVNTIAIIQYLTDVQFKITPFITFLFMDGTVPTLSLQLAAIFFVIDKVWNHANTLRSWFGDHNDRSNQVTVNINTEQQPLLHV